MILLKYLVYIWHLMGAQNYSYFNKEKLMGVLLFICLSLPLVIHWPQLATPNPSHGFGQMVCLALFPSWWSHTDTPHSLFQEAHKPLHIFVLIGKITFSSEVFLFSHSFYIFRSVYCAKFVLRANTNEISVPWGSTTHFLMVLLYWMLH